MNDRLQLVVGAPVVVAMFSIFGRGVISHYVDPDRSMTVVAKPLRLNVDN